MKRLFVLLIVLACVNNMAFSQKKSAGQVKTVVIDAGHGGAKPGAIGRQSKEKNLTLQMALKLGKLIEDNYADVKVVYTRTKDVDIALSERAHMANRAKADLFISIHCNSWANSTPTGVETYVMGLSQSKANMEVAKKENSDILLENDYKDNSDYQGFDPNSPESYVMFAMYQNAYLDKSLDFAGYIQNEYKRSIKTINRGVKQAEIFVLYKTAMPAVLTEVGFISNPEEEKYLMSDEGQAAIVVSLFNAFVSYKNQVEGTKKAAVKIDLPGYNAKSAAQSGSSVKPAAQPKQETQPDAVAEQVAPRQAEQPVSNWVPSTQNTGVEPPLPAEEPKAETKSEPAAAAPARSGSETEMAPEECRSVPAAQPAGDGSGIVYKVQFMTSSKEVKAGAREFKGVKEYEYYILKKTYCYTTGNLRTVREAVSLQKKVREMGHKDAFVIAFNNGQRISLQQAKELTQQ